MLTGARRWRSKADVVLTEMAQQTLLWVPRASEGTQSWEAVAMESRQRRSEGMFKAYAKEVVRWSYFSKISSTWGARLIGVTRSHQMNSVIPDMITG